MSHIKIYTPRLIVQQPTAYQAESISLFFKNNKKFHSEFNPTQSETFYTHNFWEKEILKIKDQFNRGINCKLFIFSQESPTVCIGSIDLEEIWRGSIQSCYLGFSLDHLHTGKGYMTEALQASFQFSKKQLNLHKIFACYDVRNIKSKAVLQKLSFFTIGTLKKYIFLNNTWNDYILTCKIL